MRRILGFLAIAVTFSALALAESFTGKLIDEACHNKDKNAACAPSGTTTSFALMASGKVYKLDPAGNAKAAAALKNRADRSEPGKPQSKDVMASVQGNESGGTITVESIDVQ